MITQHGWRTAMRKSEKEFATNVDGDAKKGEYRGYGDGQTLNGFDIRAGVRSRRFVLNSE